MQNIGRTAHSSADATQQQNQMEIHEQQARTSTISDGIAEAQSPHPSHASIYGGQSQTFARHPGANEVYAQRATPLSFVLQSAYEIPQFRGDLSPLYGQQIITRARPQTAVLQAFKTPFYGDQLQQQRQQLQQIKLNQFYPRHDALRLSRTYQSDQIPQKMSDELQDETQNDDIMSKRLAMFKSALEDEMTDN